MRKYCKELSLSSTQLNQWDPKQLQIKVKFKLKNTYCLGRHWKCSIIRRKKTHNLHKVTLMHMQQLPYGFLSD